MCGSVVAGKDRTHHCLAQGGRQESCSGCDRVRRAGGGDAVRTGRAPRAKARGGRARRVSFKAESLTTRVRRQMVRRVVCGALQVYSRTDAKDKAPAGRSARRTARVTAGRFLPPPFLFFLNPPINSSEGGMTVGRVGVLPTLPKPSSPTYRAHNRGRRGGGGGNVGSLTDIVKIRVAVLAAVRQATLKAAARALCLPEDWRGPWSES
jgi:hypothetical protein